MKAHDYRVIAAEIEQDIRGGRIAAGSRLTPQRIFAYQRGIATSTAGRVYAELRRKDLIVGEVGRGSYVRPGITDGALVAPSVAEIDLTVSRPGLDVANREIARFLSSLASDRALGRLVAPHDALRSRAAQTIAARFLAREGWTPDAGSIAFGGNAREATFAALAALLRRGDRLGTEALSFSAVKGMADRLGVSVEPLQLDAEGATPEEMERLHVDLGVSVFLLQPNLHNPLGVTMGDDRKRRVAELLRRRSILVVEDAVNAFLSDDPPLAAYAPDNVVLVDSLSKRVSPGLTIGMSSSPPGIRSAVAQAARSTAWTSFGLGCSAAIRLMEDGTAGRVAMGRRADACGRQTLAREVLAPLEIVGDARAYHLWLPLPAPWRSGAFEEEAADRGVAVSPSHLYAVKPGHAPAAIRVTLGTPSLPELRRGLELIRELALDIRSGGRIRARRPHS